MLPHIPKHPNLWIRLACVFPVACTLPGDVPLDPEKCYTKEQLAYVTKNIAGSTINKQKVWVMLAVANKENPNCLQPKFWQQKFDNDHAETNLILHFHDDINEMNESQQFYLFTSLESCCRCSSHMTWWAREFGVNLEVIATRVDPMITGVEPKPDLKYLNAIFEINQKNNNCVDDTTFLLGDQNSNNEFTFVEDTNITDLTGTKKAKQNHLAITQQTEKCHGKCIKETPETRLDQKATNYEWEAIQYTCLGNNCGNTCPAATLPEFYNYKNQMDFKNGMLYDCKSNKQTWPDKFGKESWAVGSNVGNILGKPVHFRILENTSELENNAKDLEEAENLVTLLTYKMYDTGENELSLNQIKRWSPHKKTMIKVNRINQVRGGKIYEPEDSMSADDECWMLEFVKIIQYVEEMYNH